MELLRIRKIFWLKVFTVYVNNLLLFGNAIFSDEFRDYDISQREISESKWTSSRKGFCVAG